MKLSRIPILVGAIAGSVCAANATWYTSESDFLAAINSPYYLENFTGFTPGLQLFGDLSYAAPGGAGFGWTATDSLGTGLYSIFNGISTFDPDSGLLLTFTGKPVTAFGGYLSNTDAAGVDIAGTETILLSTGETESISTPALSGGFLGWVGTSVFTSALITSAGDPQVDSYVALKHAYTGGDAPEPFTMGLGIAGIGLFIRRRVRARAKLQAV